MINDKQRLIKMLVEKGFKYSPTNSFKLVSGKMSNFYINCKPVTMSAEGSQLIAREILQLFSISSVKAIGGLTFGADPIAISTAMYCNVTRMFSLNVFSVRKTPKEHGMRGKWVEGALDKGDRVVVVDDVVTTGGSTILAIERLQDMGVVVDKVIILVDRQEEGGIEAIRTFAPVEAIINRDELFKEAGVDIFP